MISQLSKRIKKEYTDILNNEECQSNGITINPKSDKLSEWEATIKGPLDTPYDKAIFKLSITIPTDYPFRAPHVKFNTKIYHPNISEDGSICIDILKNNWSPALTLDKVLLSIVALLQEPNPEDPLRPNAATLFKSNRNEYNKKVKEYIEEYNPIK